MSTQKEGGRGGSNPGKGGSKTKSGRGPRKKRRRGLIWLFFVVLLGIVCAVVAYLLVILNGERILGENINNLNLNEASIVVDQDGKQVGKLYVAEGNREFAPIAEIPKKVRDAFVATEDKRFYEHSGIDLIGIGRALVKDVTHLSADEGASTITQQLARNLFLNADKTLFRKGTEASIALALENHKSKDEILELYLNRIYFGKGQYGIKTAAKFYFGVKDLNDLESWQIATLAGIPKAPNTYNPLSNPEKSLERRKVVLSLMEQQGLITAEERAAAAKAVYDPKKVPASNQQYLTFLDYVVEEAKAVTGLSEEELRSGGYTIETTIDTKAQKAMEDAFKNDKMFEKSKDDIPMQAAMVIMDQHDGALRAMVGGRGYEQQGWNRVTKPRQPGSSFKPISSYGPAIESGDYLPTSILRDDKTCYNNGKYCPGDSNKVKYIGPITMLQAVKESRNQPAVWLLNEIGVAKGLAFAEKLGIKLDKEKDRNLAIALGGLTNGVSPLEMARAYGAFANGGYLQDPHTIVSIKSSKGDVVYTFKNGKPKSVMKPETAYYVTQLLKGVTQTGGTGTRAAISGRTVAGKTGTTQHGIPGLSSSANRDVWFVGFTPELTAAVWMGYDQTDKEHLVRQSSGQAAAMFAAVMSKALDGKKKQSFPKPEGVDEAKPPEAVTGLIGVYSPATVSIELTWSKAPGEGVVYRIYRKTAADADFAQIAEVADPVFDDLALLPDQAYTYYVTAYDPKTKQETPPSEPVTVQVDSGAGAESPEPEQPVPPFPEEQPGAGGDEGGVPPDVGGEQSPSPSVPAGSPPPDVPAGGSPSPSPSPSPPPAA